jgi:hypothetical protein
MKLRIVHNWHWWDDKVCPLYLIPTIEYHHWHKLIFTGNSVCFVRFTWLKTSFDFGVATKIAAQHKGSGAVLRPTQQGSPLSKPNSGHC